MSWHKRLHMRLSRRRFYSGQCIFAIWNALNDPLFGWMSDTASGSRGAWRRLGNIALGGPLWAVGFAMVWIPWSTSAVSPMLSGLHFAVSLCLYDGALTFVEVNHAALLSDMTHDGPTRARANAASGVGAAIGAISSYIAQIAWASGSFGSFQVVCLAIAAASAAVIAMSVRHLRSFLVDSEQHQNNSTQQDTNKLQSQSTPRADSPFEGPMAARTSAGGAAARRGGASLQPAAHEPDGIDSATDSRGGDRQDDTIMGVSLAPAARRALMPCVPSLRKYGAFVRQLTRHRSFLIFVVVSTIQVFDCTFEKNFFAMFLDVLTAPAGKRHDAAADDPKFGPGTEPFEKAVSANAAVLTLSFILPHIATVFLTPLTQRIGVAAVLDRIFAARIVVLCFAWAVGPVSPLLSGTTVLLNRVMSECVCRAFPLVTADIVDEDTVRNGRQDSLGASVIGTAALVSKLSQSIAPMLGYSLMASITPAHSAGGASVSRTDQLFVWDILVFLPAACVAVQLAAWRAYPLRAEYMAQVKTKLEMRDLPAGRMGGIDGGTAGLRTPGGDASPPV